MTLNLQKHQGKGTYFTIIQISVFSTLSTFSIATCPRATYADSKDRKNEEN